jgi:hypothetical protein
MELGGPGLTKQPLLGFHRPNSRRPALIRAGSRLRSAIASCLDPAYAALYQSLSELVGRRPG